MRPCVTVRSMCRTIPLIAVISLATASAARAQPRQPMPPQNVWDSSGWVELRERTDNGRYDHDRSEIGRYEGKFNKLTLVVYNSDLELLDFKITFGDRT